MTKPKSQQCDTTIRVLGLLVIFLIQHTRGQNGKTFSSENVDVINSLTNPVHSSLTPVAGFCTSRPGQTEPDTAYRIKKEHKQSINIPSEKLFPGKI